MHDLSDGRHCYLVFNSLPLWLQPLCDSLTQNDHGFFFTCIHCRIQWGFAIFAFEGQPKWEMQTRCNKITGSSLMTAASDFMAGKY
jgi:hypothetical protein